MDRKSTPATARFNVGDKVLHRTKGKAGTVILEFPTEVGPRYYVDHSGFIWSIPEWDLLLQAEKSSEKILNDSNASTGRKTPILPQDAGSNESEGILPLSPEIASEGKFQRKVGR